MKRIIWTYGVISGAVVIGTIILSQEMGSGEGSAMASMEWLGYLIMLVALSVIFVAIKRYRDQELGGVIRFGTALLVGLGITAVAGGVYVGAWEVYLAVTDYAFMDEYTASVVATEEAEGASEAEIQELTARMEQMKEQYGNPLFRVPITFLEIFPIGLVISLIAAAVLRNSRVLPAGGGDAVSSTA